jgi:signal transduction histidine kinase/ligand-binding sensor domain-containing protein
MMALLLCQAAAAGSAPPEIESEYTIEMWQTDDGLPQNAVVAMAQTADGYIWLLTRDGLARFDGIRFDIFDGDQYPALAGETLVKLRSDGEGNLWLRDDHDHLVMGQNGNFRKISRPERPRADGETAWVEANDGTIWVGDERGRLLKYEKGGFPVVSDTAPTADWGPLRHLQVDTSGHPWVWTATSCARWDGEKWSVVLVENSQDAIGSLTTLEDGSVLVSHGSEKRLLRYSKGEFADAGLLPEGFNNAFISVDPTGEMWFSLPDGAACRDPQGRWSLLSRIGGHPIIGPMKCAMLDREGNRWFGTEGNGLIRLTRTAARSFGTGEAKLTESLAVDGANGVWIGIYGGGLNYFDGTRFKQAGVGFLGKERPMAQVWTVWPDGAGGVWFGTMRQGLFHMDANGIGNQRFSPATNPGMLSGPVITLFKASSGDLWIGGQTGGVARYAGGRFRLWTTRDGLSDNHVKAIAEDTSGAIWVGTASGLNRMRDKEIKCFTTADGLAGNNITSIFRDTQGSLWVGGRELTRIREGRFSVIHADNGPPATTIQAMIEDDEGYLWLSTRHGILRASLRQLNDFCDRGKTQPQFAVFTKSDGLPSNLCGYNQPSAWKGGDGRLWFATYNGIAVMDPRHLPHNDMPPPVVLEAVTADDKPLKLPTGVSDVPLRIAAGTTELDLRFAALSYTAPKKNRFRYRLQGLDQDWSKTTTSPTAVYRHLAPGSYHFQVCACNNDGVWNESGATLALRVLPFFWQTGWFRGLLAAAIVGLVYWAFRARLAQVEHRRQVQESFARQVIETQEAERRRIALELHDGVGQALILAKNHLTTAFGACGHSSAQEPIAQASTEVSEALDEIRLTAGNLRPPELDQVGIAKALEAMLDRSGHTTTTQFSSELEDVNAKWVQPEVEIQLYRIAQEAVNNVLKHSKANEVIVELKQEAQKLRLTVQDDGVGFDPARSGFRGGSGLSGMKERARLVGGSVIVKAAPGKGCRVTVLVPLLNESGE